MGVCKFLLYAPTFRSIILRATNIVPASPPSNRNPSWDRSYNHDALSEVTMSDRISISFLLLLLLVPLADGKNKKKQTLPDYVLNAQTILVVIHPDAGEPLTSPMANRTAQEDVEKAMMKWGRFKLVMDAETADLVVAVRKGHASGPTVRNSPVDDRPVIYQPSGGDVRTAGQHG